MRHRKNGNTRMSGKEKASWVVALTIVVSLFLGFLWFIPFWTVSSVATFAPFDFSMADYTWSHMASFWWLVVVVVFVGWLCE